MHRRPFLAALAGVASKSVYSANRLSETATPGPLLSVSVGIRTPQSFTSDGPGETVSERVSTGIASPSGPKRFDFTEASLLALPSASITTSTVWTPRSVFVGPLLLTVMQVVGVSSGTLICRTLDGYSAAIPWSDLVRYDVILAHSQNGKRLSNKRWGPLWTMYPRDRYPKALAGPLAESRFIWQVDQIEVTT